MTSDEIKALPTIELVFKYIEANQAGVAYIWGETSNDYRSYGGVKGRNMAEARPGMIYRFPVQERSVFHGYAEFVGTWANTDDVIQWEAMNRAQMQKRAAGQKLAKTLRESELQRHLAPLRTAYGSLSAMQRNQFLAWLVKEITK